MGRLSGTMQLIVSQLQRKLIALQACLRRNCCNHGATLSWKLNLKAHAPWPQKALYCERDRTPTVSPAPLLRTAIATRSWFSRVGPTTAALCLRSLTGDTPPPPTAIGPARRPWTRPACRLPTLGGRSPGRQRRLPAQSPRQRNSRNSCRVYWSSPNRRWSIVDPPLSVR